MNIEEIKKTINSPVGRDLKRFLIEKVSTLENIHNLKDLDSVDELAIEVKANKKASVILREILSQIGIWGSEQGRTEASQKDKYY